MTTDHFIRLTLLVIAEDGLEDYLPTLALWTDDEIVFTAYMDIPEVDTEREARSWALLDAHPDRDYHLAFKSGPSQIKVISRLATHITECEIDIPNGCSKA